MTNVHYYFRHPGSIYFSIEKLFGQIASHINQADPQKFNISLLKLPLPTGFKNLKKNIAFAKNTQTTINHVTGDIHYAILGFSKRNINILTIHDSVMLRRLSRLNPKFWIIKWIWYDLPVRKADVVTVISENTKNELISFTGCAAHRIRVIGNFYDEYIQPVPGIFNTEVPVILFIGTTENKNLERLITALKRLKVKLHIVGKPTGQQVRYLNHHEIDYKISNGLTDAQMREVYVNCDLLAFASTYEGFGLPIIEAQATGRPVVTSNISPMKEVSGDAAVLVDPYDTDSIRLGIIRIIEDEKYRNQIVEKGFENVKRFTLKTVASEYAQLYQELVTTKMNNN